jgi:hypothetical protein
MKSLNLLRADSQEQAMHNEKCRMFFIAGKKAELNANGTCKESYKIVVKANGFKREFLGSDKEKVNAFYLALLQDLRGDKVQATVESYLLDSYYRPTLKKSVSI